jgi:hypothetical protein
MITELCPACWLYHAPGANCKEANAQGQAWLVKPPVDLPPIVTLQSDNKPKRKYQRKPKCS